MATPQLPSRARTPLSHEVPTTHLAGSADARVAGWEQRVMDAVMVSERKRRRPAFALNMDLALRMMIRQAADGRGMSSSAYARRAICAFLAHDLGLPFDQVTRHCPSVADPGTGDLHVRISQHSYNGDGQPRPALRSYDDGAGYGRWVVCDG